MWGWNMSEYVNMQSDYPPKKYSKKKGSNLEPHPFQVNYQPFFFLQVKLDDDNINHYIIL